MAVPTSYIFEKASNGNVLIYAMDGSDVIETYSSNPAKDLSQSQSLPDYIIIPVYRYTSQGNNNFISIPYTKIDLAGSTPSGTNPTSPQDAIEKLQADFFFDVGGGGGIDSIVAGDNVEVDNTDPLNPVVNVTGGSPNLAPADPTVEIKIPWVDADGNTIYLLASTNND